MRGFRYIALAGLLATGIYSLPAQQAPVKLPGTVRPKPHPTPSSPLAASMARGQRVYKNVCLTCHQADGGGVPNMNPPLIKTDYVLGDKKRLVGIVLRGLKGPNEIEGETYTQNMPAQAYLTDLNIADVLTYVRNSFGNKASAVTPAEVHALRDAPAAGQ
ncbi:cytochrome c [Hymenobacter sp. RP-2-7]|uniref:Cytochrome c n=1 Tax=Hymenobacter polaris TaxID=2682546 RepID=A0A7Y0FP20_9BACT|nr:c-type cytochrome [Hymenobacter polaris]NML67171.1 cytochrome c [Hymenobacter polaris]